MEFNDLCHVKTIFITRALIHRIKAFVLLQPLLFFLLVPYVTCQQDSKPFTDHPAFTVLTIFGGLLVSVFIFVIAFCCVFYYLFQRFQNEFAGDGDEVLESRASRGLDKDAIESFPSFLYSEVKEFKIGKGGVECAICLTEFADEETLRWMPPCSHTFHANCIDVWLSSQSQCPLCRANLILKPGDSFPHPRTDLEEIGNAQRGDINSSDNNIENCTTPTRSRSTGFLSSWGKAEILFPRSHTTGHSMVQQVENLDRFTLKLPEEVQRQMFSINMMRRDNRHMALPRASSSTEGSGSRSVNFVPS